MTKGQVPDSVPVLVLEYVEPELLGIDAGATEPNVPALLMQCLAILASAGVATSTTRLVVTGNFVQSVRDRGDSEYHANYDMRRNAGAVGGKTITMPDGTVDVLLLAQMFLANRNEENVAAHTTRLVFHEAQHVVIQQAGESASLFEGEEWARRNLLIAAAQVIEEYRAEAACTRVVGGSGWSAELGTALETWLADLQRITCEEYQEHLDVGRFSYDILQETHTAWKLLGYAAAELADGSHESRAAAEHPLWQPMVAPHWRRFLEILDDVPDAEQRVPRQTLDAFARALADEFADWLLTLGFEYSDQPEGTTFWVRDWSLLLDDA